MVALSEGVPEEGESSVENMHSIIERDKAYLRRGLFLSNHRCRVSTSVGPSPILRETSQNLRYSSSPP